MEQAATREDEITIPVQINGKLRDRLVFPADASEENIKAAALASETVRKYLDGREPKKVIVVPKIDISSRNAPQVRLARKKSTEVCRACPT